jgi:glycerol-3-phosphate dehydrogenase (NAD(P)+)
MIMKNIKTVSVIGDGGWGTTLAIHLAKKGHQVCLWGAFADYVAQMKKMQVNEKFLPGIKLPANLGLTSDLCEAFGASQIILLAVPSKYISATLDQIKDLHYRGKVFVSAIKGIDPKSLLTMSRLVEKKLGKVSVTVLSGPTIAREVALGIPSTAVVASRNMKLARMVQELFNSDTFRIYTNNDVLGVEIGGSVKNIIAIACGACDGLGYGSNTKAALLTRGLAEMARLGKAMGAKSSTFSGLSGLGDLVTTCISPQSRNRTVGEQLGKGKSLKQILSSMEMVAEGLETVKPANDLAKKYKVAMPITEAVYQVVYLGKKPRQVVNDLMTRQLKAE